MRWAFGIRRKISAALLLATIFVLVFVKSLLDRQHVSDLGSSFSSVYEDRLMVESYIYRFSDHLFRKKIMIDSADSRATVENIRPLFRKRDSDIRAIIAAYEETKLTVEERRFFDAFKANVSGLMMLEEAFFAKMAADGAPADRAAIDAEFNQASANLDQLSHIQLTEGKILNDQSKKIVAGSSLLTQFEMGILIAIGLLILVLVFESTSMFTRGNQSLN